jgi:acetyl esterase/lipase
MPKPLSFLGFVFLVALTLPGRAADSATAAPQPLPKAAKPPYGWNMTIDKIPKDLKVEDNVVYKTVNGQDLKLTMFYPKVKKYAQAPLLVYIHGGGWRAGNRFVVITSGAIDVVRALNNAGVVCATIEYRLIRPGVTGMEAESDCRDAIHFLVKNAARFGIDPNRIATMGGSAGGHLSLVTALGVDQDYPCDPDLVKYPGKVLAEVADFPLVSLVDPTLFQGGTFSHGSHVDPIIGGPVEQKRAVAEKLSPTLLLKPNSPPILLVHGDQDHVLNVQNSITFAQLCRKEGVPVELIVVKGADHGFRGTNIQPSQDEINRRTVAFLLKYLLPPAA